MPGQHENIGACLLWKRHYQTIQKFCFEKREGRFRKTFNSTKYISSTYVIISFTMQHINWIIITTFLKYQISQLYQSVTSQWCRKNRKRLRLDSDVVWLSLPIYDSNHFPKYHSDPCNEMMSINLDALAEKASERIKRFDQTRFYFALNESCKWVSKQFYFVLMPATAAAKLMGILFKFRISQNTGDVR